MRTILALTLVLASIVTPVMAQEGVEITPRQQQINRKFDTKKMVQDDYAEASKQVTDDLVAKDAEHQGYCNGVPKGNKGDVVIYWTRDAQGRCLVQHMVTIR